MESDDNLHVRKVQQSEQLRDVVSPDLDNYPRMPQWLKIMTKKSSKEKKVLKRLKKLHKDGKLPLGKKNTSSSVYIMMFDRGPRSIDRVLWREMVHTTRFKITFFFKF